jgi:hypothetical protein
MAPAPSVLCHPLFISQVCIYILRSISSGCIPFNSLLLGGHHLHIASIQATQSCSARPMATVSPLALSPVPLAALLVV